MMLVPTLRFGKLTISVLNGAAIVGMYFPGVRHSSLMGVPKLAKSGDGTLFLERTS